MLTRIAVVAALVLVFGGVARSAPVASPPSNTAEPTISGTSREGETLTAATGTWSGTTPLTFAYQWRRCDKNGDGCSDRNGATSQTYTLVGGDVGHKMRVRVTATNSDGSSSATSNATATVVEGDPVNTAPPTISGTAKENETLTAGSGSWTGTGSISFSYDWRRCNTSGANCSTIASGQTYKLRSADVGRTMRVRVRAKNTYGSTTATSAQTAVVASAVAAAPVNTALPTITGTLRDGERLTASNGAWTNTPTQYSYRWLRCDSKGNGCVPVNGGQHYTLVSADVGRTIRVEVTAKNAAGSAIALSAPSALVQAKGTGAIKLPSGETSIPIDQVSSPQRLIISGVRFSPPRLTSRAAFTGRFRVTDTRGFVIRGALVYALALPYGWIRNAPEAVTGTDGWATIQFLPTARMPVRRAAVVFFLRARKSGDSLLAGVSNRRLVQVRIG